MFADNPKYKEVFHSTVHDVRFYMPEDVANGYHMSRYVAAGAQNIYAAGGATKDVLEAVMDKMLELCNDEKNLKLLRTDIATLANNIKYRLRYPVDEDCGLRMGAIYVFAEGEDPDMTEDYWTKRKLAMAKGDATQNMKPDPELYAFFFRHRDAIHASMERTVGYFDTDGLFQQKNRRPERTATTALRSVGGQVDEWYSSFWDISMKYTDGNLQAAEHFMDCGVFMYYYRMKQKAAYMQWRNEQQKTT